MFASYPGHDKLFARDPRLVPLIPPLAKLRNGFQYILLVIKLGKCIESTGN